MPFHGGGHPLQTGLYTAGAHASGTVVTLIILAAILAAVLPSALLTLYLRHRPGRRRFMRDMRNVRRRGMACACCRGENTKLRREHGQWVCKDRALCRKSMVYANMLESI